MVHIAIVVEEMTKKNGGANIHGPSVVLLHTSLGHACGAEIPQRPFFLFDILYKVYQLKLWWVSRGCTDILGLREASYPVVGKCFKPYE